MSKPDILEKIVVEISRDGKASVGTGFYISEDKVATCFHVLVPNGAGLEQEYWIKHDTWETWKTAKPIPEKCCSPPKDVAILQCQQENMEVAEIKGALKHYDGCSKFRSRGYDEAMSSAEFGAIEIDGEIVGDTHIYEPKTRRLQLRTAVGAIKSGRSGSPIFSLLQNAVVGMIDYLGGQENKDAEISTAIPIEVVLQLSRPIEKHIDLPEDYLQISVEGCKRKIIELNCLRMQSIANHIHENIKMLEDLENKSRLEDNPKERRKLNRRIDQIKSQLEKLRKEHKDYLRDCEDVSRSNYRR